MYCTVLYCTVLYCTVGNRGGVAHPLKNRIIVKKNGFLESKGLNFFKRWETSVVLTKKKEFC